MRQTLILLALTSAPAFCQDGNLNARFDRNFLQRIPKITLQKPRPVLKLQISRTEQVCAIPLLNAKPAGTSDHMPEIRIPQGVSDHMAVKPPAPACPAR